MVLHDFNVLKRDTVSTLLSCVKRHALFAVQALSNDAAFVRVRKGVYALRALAGNVGPVPHNTPKSSRPPLGRAWDHRDSYRSVSSSHVCHHCPVANMVLWNTSL